MVCYFFGCLGLSQNPVHISDLKYVLTLHLRRSLFVLRKLTQRSVMDNGEQQPSSLNVAFNTSDVTEWDEMPFRSVKMDEELKKSW